jgi:hypothetical protein
MAAKEGIAGGFQGLVLSLERCDLDALHTLFSG